MSDLKGQGMQQAQELVDFWLAQQAHWFAKSDAFDALFTQRYASLHEAAAAGQLQHWLAQPVGALALLILLDQYPRNAFRDTPRMYATDAAARDCARQALALGHAQHLPAPELGLFFCLPFAHSEALADQALSVQLYEALAPAALSHGLEHQRIVQRFGRFPHRNAILGRASTPEEAAFLAEGGFAG